MSITLNQIELRESRDFSGVTTAVFAFIRENFKLFFRSILYIVGTPSLIGSALLGSSVSVRGMVAGSVPALLGMVVGSFLLLLSWTLTVAVVNSFVFLYMERGKGNFGIQDVWQETRVNLGNVVGTSFWLVVLSIGVYVVFALSVVFSLFLAALLGIVLFILAVHFAIALVPIYTVRLYEDVTLSESITRSRELTRGYWLLSFGVFAVPYIIAMLISYTLAIPAYAVDLNSEYIHDLFYGRILMALLSIIASTFAAAVLTAVPVLASTFQYFNLVEKLDGVGMMDRIEQMGSNDLEDTGIPAGE